MFQFSSVTQLCPTLCDPMNWSMPGLPVHHQLPEFTQTHVHRVGDAIQPSHPLLSPSPLPPNPPSIRIISNESTLHMRWPKYWSFSLSISPSNEHPGLISFRMDWLDLFAVQETLKSLLQHRSSKASILWCSAVFTVQLSHPHMTTGKTIALTRYADDTTLMAESEEELKSLLMKVKGKSEKVGLKLNIQKTKIMASSPITSWEIDGETGETVSDFIFLGSKITADGDCSHEIKRRLLLGRKVMTNLDSILKCRNISLCQQRSI